MKQPSNHKFWIMIGVSCLLFFVALRWFQREHSADRQTASESSPNSGQDDNSFTNSNALTQSSAKSPAATTARPASYADLASLEAADERGELMGTMHGPKTPEELLFDITELRAEPFAPLVLDYLEKALPELKMSRDRIRAAALLHRYGRQRGTDYLRDYLQATMGSAEGALAATTLAMSKDEPSLSLIAASIKSYIADPEFAQAIADWGEPALLTEAKSLLNQPSAPWGRVAIVLADVEDKTAIPLLQKALQGGSKSPLNYAYEAALARLEAAPAEPIVESLRQAIQRPNLAGGSVPEAIRLLGPDQAAPIIDDIIRQYTRLRADFGEKYDAHANAVHAGNQTLADLPAYPISAEHLFLQALDLAKDWKMASLASNIYEALAAAQTGRYTFLHNRQIMAVLSELDLNQSRLRLQNMGFPDKEIDAAFQLSQLRPIPHLLSPRQGKIAMSKASRPEPP